MAQGNRMRNIYSDLERTTIVNPQTLLDYLLTWYPIFLMLLFVVVCVIQVASGRREQGRAKRPTEQR